MNILFDLLAHGVGLFFIAIGTGGIKPCVVTSRALEVEVVSLGSLQAQGGPVVGDRHGRGDR